MSIIKKAITITALLFSIMSCNSKEPIVVIETDLGTMKVKLYNETPKHRDNFLKLAKEGFYNDLLFHRVIKGFMIQGGDPESKGAPAGKQLGSGENGYRVPAEFAYPTCFHKKGALAAARLGDEVNPAKESSGCQFYIVQGKTYNDSELAQLEKSMKNQATQSKFYELAAQHKDEVMTLRRNRDQQGLMALQEKIIKEAEAYVKEHEADFKMSENVKAAYKEVGGTPFLDGQYTVFGEVTEGLEIIDKIAAVKTLPGDRPETDVKIIKVTVEE